MADRFSYTYYHPEYFRVLDALDGIAGTVPVASLQELCEDGFPRRGQKPSEESSEGIPIIKVRNITGNGIDIDTDYAPDNEEILESCSRGLLVQNDVLLTCTGEGTIGRVDVYPYEEPSIADGHVAISRLQEGVNPHFVAEFLRSEFGQIQMFRHVSGSTGQTELLIRYVESIRVPLPDLEMQDQIVAQLQRARTDSNALVEEAEKIREESANIIASARADMYARLRDA